MSLIVAQIAGLSPMQLLLVAFLALFSLGWVLWAIQIYRRARRTTGRESG
jgi:hypothetical protein